MQDFLGSVRRSLVFKPSTDDLSGFVEKIGSSIRKSRIGMFARPPVNTLTLPPMEDKSEGEPRATASSKVREVVTPLPTKIRWKKGELIGCGAFGRVYMGMNCDSGELLAVKEVAITTNASSKKTQEYIQELEKEVNLLKNLSHPNIVRYLGTVREEDSLNILLEFVPGGSIASLLGNFGCFPESVIRMYTKQLLLGLEYLHKNKIMHRDIKGANILVDNNGCIKLADFGASKKVEALATITGAKSMKGTPYWMAPEVIVQSGHSYSADIWSVGCTIIEMATGKAPWSQQYQEVAALFHVGTTKAHPPIPDHLSAEAKDFLLKCFKEPELRPTASELLEQPFVTGECQKSPVLRSSPMLEKSGKWTAAGAAESKNSMNTRARRSCNGFKDVGELSGGSCLTNCPEQFSDYESLWIPGNFDDDDMCRIDDDDDLELGASMKFTPDVLYSPSIKSFNPTSVSKGDRSCKFDESPELNRSGPEIFQGQMIEPGRSINCGEVGGDFAFPREQIGPEDDDEVTESKIRAFLVEKAIELKKLQTPLYEFYNSLSVTTPHSPACVGKENVASNCNLPPKSKSPNRGVSRRLSTAIDAEHSPSPGTCSRRASNIGDINLASSQDVREILCDSRDPITPRFTEIQRKWKEELAQELERSRELLRLAGVGKTSSPKDRLKQKDRSRFASPGK